MREKIEANIAIHKKMLAELEKIGVAVIEAVAGIVIETLEGGGKVLVCGNGGSAADAQHIAAELVGRYRKERKGLGAIALTTDSSAITSIANDYGFENIFARQVEALGVSGDVLWAFSTSGTSANIIKAVGKAREKGLKVIGFTGRKDSLLEELSDVCFCADAETSDASQEMHQVAYHIVCGLVEDHFVCE